VQYVDLINSPAINSSIKNYRRFKDIIDKLESPVDINNLLKDETLKKSIKEFIKWELVYIKRPFKNLIILNIKGKGQIYYFFLKFGDFYLFLVSELFRLL
jgi:hypothetical protein